MNLGSGEIKFRDLNVSKLGPGLFLVKVTWFYVTALRIADISVIGSGISKYASEEQVDLM